MAFRQRIFFGLATNILGNSSLFRPGIFLAELLSTDWQHLKRLTSVTRMGGSNFCRRVSQRTRDTWQRSFHTELLKLQFYQTNGTKMIRWWSIDAGLCFWFLSSLTRDPVYGNIRAPLEAITFGIASLKILTLDKFLDIKREDWWNVFWLFLFLVIIDDKFRGVLSSRS